MGAWGSSLYANDCSCDVRDTYMKFLQEQMSNEEAYQRTIEKHHEYIGDEDEPLLWYALADTQWKTGRLMPKVKEKALGWIENGGGMTLWEESKSGGAGWKKTLEKLKKQLECPLPPEKTIKKPVEFVRNPWSINDVYAYQLHGEKAVEKGFSGKYILLQKIGDVDWLDGWICSRIQVLDRIFDQLPTLDDIDGVRILPLAPPENYKPEWQELWDPMQYMNAMLCYDKKSDYKEKYYTFVGNKIGPANNVLRSPYSNLDWRTIDDWLIDYYLSWQSIEYIIVGEGQYSFRP
jgi:hypothetical protein